MVCVFCNIAKKEIKTELLYEDNEVIAFKDIKPSAPIHYLVIPKDHVQSINHLEVRHKDMISKLVFVAKDLAAKASIGGYKLVFNVGREGGQVIDHLHLHLLGGWGKKEEGERMPHPSLDK